MQLKVFMMPLDINDDPNQKITKSGYNTAAAINITE
jgi:hypothetical protein